MSILKMQKSNTCTYVRFASISRSLKAYVTTWKTDEEKKEEKIAYVSNGCRIAHNNIRGNSVLCFTDSVSKHKPTRTHAHMPV